MYVEPFEVGDEVEVTNKHSIHFGKIGVVEEVDDSCSEYEYRVYFKDSEWRWYHESNLVLVKDQRDIKLETISELLTEFLEIQSKSNTLLPKDQINSFAQRILDRI